MSQDNDIDAELKKIDADISQIDRAIEKLGTKKQKLLARKKTLRQKIQDDASEKLASLDWERTDHPWSKTLNNTLKAVFKLNRFRPFQLATVNAVMSKHDCILLMPTGGGKSLCYQLPAMVLEGITVVVSPLISLIEDQIMAMEALDIPATMLNASSTRQHASYVLQQMTEKKPAIKLIYVTPEKLAKSKRFMTKLEKLHKMGNFSLLAIDEVHCCSQWGHDFRPDYKFLGIMKRQFPNTPILGLTATATSAVVSDVQKILNIPGCLVLRASFNRPNLKYEVQYKSSSQKDNITELENLLKNRFNALSGIIYCFSIKDSEEIANGLRSRGIKARAYHAQLDAKSRSAVHKSWSTNSVQVIVATVAFGMGIDKPDVRFVIHHSMPKSMENFYQESGRAGRDDQVASCILFFRFPDVFRQSTMIFTEQKGLEHLYAMVAYCLDLKRCRRAIIADHFGERWNPSDCNSMCDHCDRYSPYVEKIKNVAKEYRVLRNILEFCNRQDERITSLKLIDVWQGKGLPKLRPPGHKATNLNRDTCERIIGLLLLESFLIEEFHFTPYSTISYINIGSRTLPTDQELPLPMPVLKSIVNPSDLGISNDIVDTRNQAKTETPPKKKTKTKSSPDLSPCATATSSPTQIPSSPLNEQSSSSSKKPPVILCVVNEEKSHFLTECPRSSKSDSSSNKMPKPKKKPEVHEAIELSDDDSIDFDEYQIPSNKRKNSSHEHKSSRPNRISSSDSDENFNESGISRKKKVVNNHNVQIFTVSDDSD